LEVRLRIAQLRLGLLNGGARLLDLRLQRARVDLRQQVAQLDLLTGLQVDRLELPGNLEGQKTDVGRLQHAREPAHAALRRCRDFVHAESPNRLFRGLFFLLVAGLQAEEDQAT
jgi:hypothetical protein